MNQFHILISALLYTLYSDFDFYLCLDLDLVGYQDLVTYRNSPLAALFKCQSATLLFVTKSSAFLLLNFSPFNNLSLMFNEFACCENRKNNDEAQTMFPSSIYSTKNPLIVNIYICACTCIYIIFHKCICMIHLCTHAHRHMS